jgi:uroporphyrinogen III methyltransferase / synthase
MGRVYLIGAGPGNEELMTLKAARVLKKCTAVLYDRLAGEHVLNYLSKDCKIYYCGKEPGCHYKSQEEINEMLIRLAKEDHIVGRIKGGDPYVFGRGGEEGEALFKEGVELEVIPGVTSAISVLSYAGIPITSRGYSQSFHVFTGMSAAKLNINWQSVAQLTGTFVFLMGLENIEMIMEKLISGGKALDTPAAVIMRGTTAKQKIVVGNLEDICSKVREAGFKSPCIIVVGEVVKLSEVLNWYEKKPLFGMNICVTRSKVQAAPLKERLMDLGAEVTEINAIEIKPTADILDKYTTRFHSYDYIVLTSVNAVNIFFDYLREKCIDLRKIKGNFAVIGPATERALMERGIKADIIAEEFVGEKLSEKLIKVLNSESKVLIPCSSSARDNLSAKLKATGAEVEVAYIYETVQGEVRGTGGFSKVDIVLYTSPSIVNNMINQFGIEAVKSKKALAIGPITEKELLRHGVECIVSNEYSTEGMINKLMELHKEGSMK